MLPAPAISFHAIDGCRALRSSGKRRDASEMISIRITRASRRLGCCRAWRARMLSRQPPAARARPRQWWSMRSWLILRTQGSASRHRPCAGRPEMCRSRSLLRSGRRGWCDAPRRQKDGRLSSPCVPHAFVLLCHDGRGWQFCRVRPAPPLPSIPKDQRAKHDYQSAQHGYLSCMAVSDRLS